MRLTTVLLIATLLQVSATTFGQRITINERKASFEKVLKSIRAQSGYDVLMDRNILKNTAPINVSIKDATIDEAMKSLLEGLPLKYSIDGKIVVIEEKEPTFLERLAERWAAIDVRGRVVDEQGNPMPNASIQIKGTSKATTSNEKGEFLIKDVAEDAILVIRYVGYKALEIPVKGANMPLEIKLNQLTGQLEEVAVKGNTGYQVIDKNHPGSFDVVDNDLLNRRVSTNILDRIENLTPGVLFDRNASARDPLLIRGRNSIYGEVSPLIVLDNFPYDGDVKNINPNDIENITILKDASSAAIWGARAGNGVIVITTKQGITQKPRISFNTNFTVQSKPNLFAMPIISSTDAVELERFVFSKGYYDADISNNILHPPLTPVQEILLNERNGAYSRDYTDELLSNLKMKDVRNDLSKHFYRAGTYQQHSTNISGNSQFINYFLSAGYDKNASELVGQSSNRITLRSQNTFRIASWIQVEGGINYNQNNSINYNNPGIGINSGSKGLYPYADLVDDSGKSLILVKDYRIGYVDTAGRGETLDWHYRPYEDIYHGKSENKGRDVILNVGTKLQLNSFSSLDIKYQFQNSLFNGEKSDDVDSYYARNLINNYYQPTGPVKYPIPIGGMLSKSVSEVISHQARIQFNINKQWNDKHLISSVLGWEIKDLKKKDGFHNLYGYNSEYSSVNNSMDFVTRYPQYYFPDITVTIPNIQLVGESVDRFLSYYANLKYSYNKAYTISFSAREDAANLFGVRTNERGVPLWSVGIAWELSNESWFKSKTISSFSLRGSYGSTGNFTRNASAKTTISRDFTSNGVTYATIVTPPYENLRWERNQVLNLGFDFGILKNRIFGKIEYFRKNNKDLMGLAPIDPTMGVVTSGLVNNYYGNVASVRGHGVEVALDGIIINSKKIRWAANILFSYAQLNVSKYLLAPPNRASGYINPITVNPLIGKPVYSVFSYQWGGLDTENGDPLGYLGKSQSKNYSEILNNTRPDSLIYNGPAQPPYFGAFRNSISYKNISLSIGLSYKLGYYFRRQSIVYGDLLATWTGHADYAKRWQESGDELKTNVPSLTFPLDDYRDQFFSKSSVLVESGSHIRLEDISLSYSLKKSQSMKWLPAGEIYAYAGNLNLIIWQKSKSNVDPFLNGNLGLGKSISLGIRFNL